MKDYLERLEAALAYVRNLPKTEHKAELVALLEKEISGVKFVRTA